MLHSARQILAVLVDREQRVVDADSEADHDGQRGPDRRDREHVGEQADDAKRSDQAEDGGQDRQAHRDEAAERERKDDHRGEQAHRLAALRRRGGKGAADGSPGRDLDALFLGRRGGIEDAPGEVLGDLAVADLQQHGDEGGAAVRAHQRRGGVAERVGGGVDIGRLEQGLVGGLDRVLVAFVGDLALADVEDDRVGAVLLGRELGGQQI